MDLVSFGSLSGELSRMSALRQLKIVDCEVSSLVGIDQLTSLEYLQVPDAISTECRRALIVFVSLFLQQFLACCMSRRTTDG